MAFDVKGLMRVSTGMNYEVSVNASTGVVAPRTNGIIDWSYNTADTMATVLNPAYFLPAMIVGGTSASQIRLFAPGDRINIRCASDAAIVTNGGSTVSFTIEVMSVTVPVINSPPVGNVNPSFTYRPIGDVMEYAVIPSANILAGTLVQITSTPYLNAGVGYLIMPTCVNLTLAFNTTAYTGAATHSIVYNGQNVSLCGTITADFVNSAENATFAAFGSSGFIVNANRVGPLMFRSTAGAGGGGNSPIYTRTHYTLIGTPT